MALLGAWEGRRHHNHHRKGAGLSSTVTGALRSCWTVLPCYTAAAFVAGCLVTMMLQQLSTSSTSAGSSDCAISLGHYKGPHYVHPTQTVTGRGRCLVESKFLKVQQHSVQFPPSSTDREDNKSQHPLLPPRIDDWLWIDYHDRINVLVEAAVAPPPPRSGTDATNDSPEPQFQIFQQTKYALEGRDSLAIVGGIVEPGEEPATAARREVAEETGHDCSRWHSLGRYRTDVNRGMGWTHAYVAQDCHHSSNRRTTSTTTTATNPSHGDAAGGDEVGVADTERQDLRIMSLSEVRQAVQNGEFLEIQWSATVALAMLYYEHRNGEG